MNKIATLLTVLLFMVGCDDHRDHRVQQTPTRTETTVNVQSYLMDAESFDMETVIGRLKQGDLANAQGLQDFINQTPGINNIDLDKDGQIDSVTVTEERGTDGGIIMAVRAHPSSGQGEPTAVAELGFVRNTQTGQVEVSGSYPSYVRGHDHYYYRHTLTGSHIGDAMFYAWLFTPHRPYYAPVYRPGLYVHRPIMSRSQMTTSRTSYRTQHSISPVKKASKPASYKPKSSYAQKTAAKHRASGGSLSSKAGQATGFKKSTASKTQKAGAFRPKTSSTTTRPTTTRPTTRPASRPAPRPASRRRTSSSRSGGFGRRSLAMFKHDISYLSDAERQAIAEEFYGTSLATWQYNEDLPEGDGREHLGIIIDDVGPGVMVESSGEEVDLYGYTSVIGAAAQQNHIELELLREEVQRLRYGICQ